MKDLTLNDKPETFTQEDTGELDEFISKMDKVRIEK